MNLNLSPFVILLGIGAAALVLLAAAAVGRRKVIRTPDGEVIVVPTEFDQLLAPLVRFLTSGKRRDLEQVARDLDHARISRFSPEVWVVLPWLLGIGGALALLTLVSAAGTDPALAIIVCLIGGFLGFMYPRVTLSGRLRRRQAAIKEDVLPFMAQFARTATVARDMTTTFEIMNGLAKEEREQFEARARLSPAERRRLERMRMRSPYASDLWVGLALLMRQASGSLYRGGADYAHPDPLIEFAVFADDPDFARFIDKLRQASAAIRNLSPEQLDIDVSNLQIQRVAEVQGTFARMLSESTFVMVMFCFPLLLIAALAPTIGSLIGLFGGI